jgi:aminopeptidase
MTTHDYTALYERYRSRIETIGREMVTLAAEVQPGRNVLILFDEECRILVDAMVAECDRIGADIALHQRNARIAGDRLRTTHDTELAAVVDELFADEAAKMAVAETVLIARIEDPSALDGVSDAARALYATRYKEIHARRVSGEQRWCLTIWPTPAEAAQEGMTYEDYFALCMHACTQPWEAIKEAQDRLCTVLDPATTLELHANEDDPDPKRHTHLTMSIAGMTFCNSTIDANYPGSEVFSAPVRESVNGQVFAEGEYVYEGSVIRDIFLRFENGRIVEATAGDMEGQAALDEILSRPGNGTRYLGEVALGTNPALVSGLTANGLFAEKKAGSFHIAIGECYTFTEYGGKTVNLNNGNTDTSIHWDIAVSMVRNPDGTGGGRVVVDGKTVQKDGFFVDPSLAVLNPNP